MTKSDNPADLFEKALAEATKMLAGTPDLSVSYSVSPAGMRSAKAAMWSNGPAYNSPFERALA